MNYVLTWQLWIQGLSFRQFLLQHTTRSMELSSSCRCDSHVPFFIVKPILPILMSWTNPRECLPHSQSSLDVLPNTSHGTFFLGVLRSGQKRSLESWAINLCCTGARQPLVRAHTPRCIPFFKAAVLLHASNVAVPVRISGSCLQHTRESVFRGPPSSHCSSHNTTIQKLAASTKTKWAAGSFVNLGSETKGVIYYYIRVVYTQEGESIHPLRFPAFLVRHSGRCSVFLHVTVYNMHIILEACSPSASVSGCMGVFKKKSMHLSLVCVLHLSAAAHFCSEEAKMLKSKQIFFFFPLT